jgi:hypothetical protein
VWAHGSGNREQIGCRVSRPSHGNTRHQPVDRWDVTILRRARTPTDPTCLESNKDAGGLQDGTATALVGAKCGRGSLWHITYASRKGRDLLITAKGLPGLVEGGDGRRQGGGDRLLPGGRNEICPAANRAVRQPDMPKSGSKGRW